MTTYIKCLSPEYSPDLILDSLRCRVENLIGAFGDEGLRVELRPREDEDIFDESDAEERQRRAARKAQPAKPVNARVALGAAAPKSGDTRKKRLAEEAEDPKKKTKRDETAPGGGVRLEEAKKAKVVATAATKALMGGHPQMVVARQKAGGAPPARVSQPWLDHLSVGDDGDDEHQPSRLVQHGKFGRKPPGGGGGDGDDDDGDDDDRKGHGGRNKRKSSEDDRKKKKKKKKRKRSESDDDNPQRGSGRASHIFPVGDKRKRRKDGSGGDPDSSSSDDGKKRGDRKSKKVEKKKRKDKKKRRKSRSSETSSKSHSGTDSQAEFYGKDSSRYESLAEKARKKPGMLLKSGLTQMAKFLTIRTGGTDEEASRGWRDQRVGAYLNQVLFTQHSQEKLGLRNVRELVTLAEAIDLLMEGQFAAVGDVLMQRMKAVESSVTDGWQMASHQELIPPAKASHPFH